jgi:hypothetical protein
LLIALQIKYSTFVDEGHFDANFGMVATYLGNGNARYPGYRLLGPNGAGYLTANLIGPQGPWADDAHFGLTDIDKVQPPRVAKGTRADGN